MEKYKGTVVTIENKDGILYSCTKLELNDFRSQEELQNSPNTLQGSTVTGGSEGFEQRISR